VGADHQEQLIGFKRLYRPVGTGAKDQAIEPAICASTPADDLGPSFVTADWR